MKNYEAMFIFKPNLSEEKLDEEIKVVEEIMKTSGKGEVKSVNMGKRTLAYEIEKFNEGIYVNYMFTAQPLTITKIKESLKHKDDILRFMILLGGKQK